MLDWVSRPFDALTGRQVHDLLALRQRVFVVEQRCAYLDADGLDPRCVHVLGAQRGTLVACARVVPPGLAYAEPAIGRVVTAPELRRRGAGRELMREAIAVTRREYPRRAVRIGAQRYLEAFYGSLGFVRDGEPYDEDGIPHLPMVLPG